MMSHGKLVWNHRAVQSAHQNRFNWFHDEAIGTYHFPRFEERSPHLNFVNILFYRMFKMILVWCDSSRTTTPSTVPLQAKKRNFRDTWEGIWFLLQTLRKNWKSCFPEMKATWYGILATYRTFLQNISGTLEIWYSVHIRLIDQIETDGQL